MAKRRTSQEALEASLMSRRVKVEDRLHTNTMYHMELMDEMNRIDNAIAALRGEHATQDQAHTTTTANDQQGSGEGSERRGQTVSATPPFSP